MVKNFLLDTNVFFLDPECINKFKNNNVYLAIEVLEELDKHKIDKGVNGFNVRRAINLIEKSDTIKFTRAYAQLPLDMSINDNKIIGYAKKANCILVTNDVAMRVKCKIVGVVAEPYKNQKQIEVGNIRKGYHIFNNEDEMLSRFYSQGYLDTTEEMYNNDYIIFRQNDKDVQYCKVKDNRIIRTDFKKGTPEGVEFKNVGQKMAYNQLTDPDLEIVSITGTMGVGKNYIAISTALSLVEQRRYKKIYICKPPLPLNKAFELGFRPSGFIEKVTPTLSSFTSNIGNLKGKNGVDMMMDYLDFNIIEIIDLENIQGMSFSPNSIIIYDELQLIEAKNDGRALLSRVGEDSLVICLGDLKQMASQRHTIENSALHHLISVFSGYEKYAHITLEQVVRSGFVAELDKRW